MKQAVSFDMSKNNNFMYTDIFQQELQQAVNQGYRLSYLGYCKVFEMLSVPNMSYHHIIQEVGFQVNLQSLEMIRKCHNRELMGSLSSYYYFPQGEIYDDIIFICKCIRDGMDVNDINRNISEFNSKKITKSYYDKIYKRVIFTYISKDYKFGNIEEDTSAITVNKNLLKDENEIKKAKQSKPLKLTEEQIRLICSELQNGSEYPDICKELGYSGTNPRCLETIRLIHNNEIHQDIMEDYPIYFTQYQEDSPYYNFINDVCKLIEAGYSNEKIMDMVKQPKRCKPLTIGYLRYIRNRKYCTEISRKYKF